MVDITILTTFFGWCSVINIALIFGLFIRGRILRNFAVDLFEVSSDEIKLVYLKAVMQYRNGTLLLSVTPYLALKVMTWNS